MKLPSVIGGMLATPDAHNDGSYRLLYLYGARSHACGAWVAQDVLFFDANYGEFWFPTKEAFQSWFFQFWHASMYPGLCDTYFEIKPYVRGL